MHVSGSVRFLRAAAARTVDAGTVLRLAIGNKSADGSVTLTGRGVRIITSELPDLPARGRVTVRIVSLKPTLKLEVLPDPPPGDTTVLTRSRLEASERTGTDLLSDLYHRVLGTTARNVDTTAMHKALMLYRRFYGEPRTGERRSVQRGRMRGIIELADRDMSLQPSEESVSLLQWLAGLPGFGDHLRDEPGSRHEEAGDTDDNAFHNLGRYLRRTTDEPNSFLQLYNVLAPAGDLHWVLIPIRGADAGAGVDADRAVEIEGVLKVAWHMKRRKPVQAVLSVATGKGANWWFHWVIRETDGTSKFVLRDSGSDGKGLGQQVDQNLLAGLGFPGHTESVERQVESDGFTLRSCEGSVYPEVDTYG